MQNRKKTIWRCPEHVLLVHFESAAPEVPTGSSAHKYLTPTCYDWMMSIHDEHKMNQEIHRLHLYETPKFR